MNIHDFIKQLRLSKVYTSKQTTVIDNLYIYINNMKVYKVVIAVNPNMRKKARRLGLQGDYITTYFDDVPITIEGEYIDKTKPINIKEGKYIVIYNPNSGNATVYPGEETEQEQLKNLCLHEVNYVT